jgi:hypothetical protein
VSVAVDASLARLPGWVLDWADCGERACWSPRTRAKPVLSGAAGEFALRVELELELELDAGGVSAMGAARMPAGTHTPSQMRRP